jgi:hypothetical protein
MVININWSEQLKLRVRESTDAQYRHLLVKTLIMLAIRIKKSRNLKHQTIYSEFKICEGKVCDVYNEDLKNKEIYAYEIQENVNQQWINKTSEIYKNFEELKTIGGFKSVTWILIKLKDIPDTHKQIWEWVKEQVL